MRTAIHPGMEKGRFGLVDKFGWPAANAVLHVPEGFGVVLTGTNVAGGEEGEGVCCGEEVGGFR